MTVPTPADRLVSMLERVNLAHPLGAGFHAELLCLARRLRDGDAPADQPTHQPPEAVTRCPTCRVTVFQSSDSTSDHRTTHAPGRPWSRPGIDGSSHCI